MKTLSRLRLFPPRARPAAKPVPRRRRAAAALRWGALAAALLLVGMAVAVETVKPQWRDPEYGYRLKQLRRVLKANPDRPLVVVLGSSRTVMGLSPLAMGFADAPGSPLVYNFGLTGSGPLRLLHTFRRLRAAGVKPDAVLVEFFPLAVEAVGPVEVQMKDQLPKLAASDFKHIAPYCDDVAAFRRAWAAERIASWSSLRLSLVSHWQAGWLPWPKRLDYQWTMLDRRGWFPYPVEVVTDELRAAATAVAHREYAAYMDSFAPGVVSERALRDLVESCRTENIRVAFYLTPEGPTFRSWYTPAAVREIREYLEIVRTLAPVFDSTDGLVETDFWDSHHLLRGGAAKFSKKLAAEHLAGWVGGEPRQ